MKTGISTTIAALMLGMVAAIPTGATAATLDGLSGDLYRLYQLTPDGPVTILDDIPFSVPGDNTIYGYPSGLPNWSISGTQITLGMPVFGNNFSALPFNGWKIVFSSDPGIVSVALDPASQITEGNADITFTSDSISFNFQGQRVAGTFVYDIGLSAIETPPGETPLPAALPLFASGLGALGLFAHRRKRQARKHQ